jgi:feruloyl esterase
MLPGVEHCRGGPGADNIGGSGAPGPDTNAEHDLLTTLEDWVERGRAPGALIASKLENGRVARTHRICPYPQQAKYLGRGDTSNAANYRCML